MNRRGLVVFAILAMLSVYGIAAVATLRESRDAVRRHLSVWEEDVARSLLLQGDQVLFAKVRSQIQAIAPDAVSTVWQSANAPALAASECALAQPIELTLYGTPAGEMTICRSVRKIAARSLLSPIFALGMVLIFAALFWLENRRRRVETTTQKLENELHTERAISLLAKQVAHDIQAPVGALRAAIDAIARQQNNQNVAAPLNLLDSTAKRIDAIADELLDRARQANADKTAVAASLHSIANELQATTRTPIEVHVDADSDIRLTIPPLEFERALSNLVRNAIEATEAADQTAPADRRIKIQARRQDESLIVEVIDAGVGIPRALLGKIGRPGFTLGKARGNGLGVASAILLAKRLGGRLDIASNIGRGTHVQLVTPLN